MSDTPRTDAWKRVNDPIEDLHIFARQLERELNAAQERIKRLEEAEMRLLNWLTEDCPESVKKQLSNAWMKSKEAKP